MATKSKLWALIEREEDNGYRHVTITLVKADCTWNETIFRVRWQSDAAGRARWYTPRVSCDDGGENGEMFALAAKILRNAPVGNDPAAWFAHTGAEHAVDDRRVSRNVLASAVLPVRWRRFMARGADGCCAVNAVCDPVNAEREIVREWAREIGNSPSIERAFIAWNADGRQIEEDTRATPPEVMPLTWLFEPLGKVEVVETATLAAAA